MRLTIKVKQVLGVVSTVGLATGVITGFYVSSLVRISLDESRGRGELLANAIFHRASALVAAPDLSAALQERRGPAVVAGIERGLLQQRRLRRDCRRPRRRDRAQRHSNGQARSLPPTGDMDDLLGRGTIGQLRAIYSDSAKTLEVREPLVLGTTAFGSIRIGVSTLLIRRELAPALQTGHRSCWSPRSPHRRWWRRCSPSFCCGRFTCCGIASLGWEKTTSAWPTTSRATSSASSGDSLAAVSARLLADRAGHSTEHAAPETPGWLEDAVAVFNAERRSPARQRAHAVAAAGASDRQAGQPAPHRDASVPSARRGEPGRSPIARSAGDPRSRRGAHASRRGRSGEHERAARPRGRH